MLDSHLHSSPCSTLPLPPMSKRKRTSASPHTAAIEDRASLSIAEIASDDDEAKSTEANDGSLAEGPGESGESLFGLHKLLLPFSRQVRAYWTLLNVLTLFDSMLVQLMDQPIADDEIGVCHLRDVPSELFWSPSNTLKTAGDRAVVIVAFGNLTSVALSIQRGKPARLRVAIELVRQVERNSMQMIYDRADIGKCASRNYATMNACIDTYLEVATRELFADRVSYDARSRLLNVYDRTGPEPWRHKLRMMSVNELVGGDVVRLEMRCVRVRERWGFRVDFKLKSIQLVAAVPRGVDITR